MIKICVYTACGDIARTATGMRFLYRVETSGLTQQTVARRIGISRSRLNELLNGSTRYRWSEDIARRIMRALKPNQKP